MSGFAAAYNGDANDVWLNYLLEDIVESRRDASCRRTGQDYDDDTVDAPGNFDANNVHTATTLSRNVSHRPKPQQSRSFTSIAQRVNSHGSPRSEEAGLHSRGPTAHNRRLRSPSSARSATSSSHQHENSLTAIITPPQRTFSWSRRRPAPERLSTLSTASTALESDPEKIDLEKTSSLGSPQAGHHNIHFQHHSSLGRLEEDVEKTAAELAPEGLVEVEDGCMFPPHPGVKPMRRYKSRPSPEPSLVENPEAQYPAPLPLALIVLGVCLSVFIISMDRSIVTTAIPKITDEFHSYDDVGWYGSGYLLTACAFQPLYGRVFTSFSTKSTFLSSVAVFEIGSLVCALAPTSPALIIGRAVQGLGAAGVLTGSFVVVTRSVPLVKRPVYFAAIGILFGVGALIGPLLGGVFTDTVSWRWCFYINLPIGGVTFLTVFLFFKRQRRSAITQLPFLKRVLALDLIGNAILLSAAVMLFLALQYTEQSYGWSSARVSGLLTGFSITTVIFLLWLSHKGDAALLPPRIILQRTVSASCLAAFFTYAGLLVHTYYLPIWFEAVRGTSAIHAGVNMIPYMLANALFSLLAGIFVSKHGQYAPPAILGYAIATIGCGLITTFNITTSSATWIGYEVLTSAGFGLAIQQGFTAVQTSLPLEDVPIGTAAVVASQSLGGSIFVSVGNTLLQNYLLDKNNDNAIPGVDIRVVLQEGATAFRNTVPAASLPALLNLYDEALRKVFIAAVPMAGLAFVASLGMEWNSVRGEKKVKGVVEEKGGVEEMSE